MVFDSPGVHKKNFVELEKSSIFVLTVPGKDSGHRQAGKQPSNVLVIKRYETDHHFILAQSVLVEQTNRVRYVTSVARDPGWFKS